MLYTNSIFASAVSWECDFAENVNLKMQHAPNIFQSLSSRIYSYKFSIWKQNSYKCIIQ